MRRGPQAVERSETERSISQTFPHVFRPLHRKRSPSPSQGEARLRQFTNSSNSDLSRWWIQARRTSFSALTLPCFYLTISHLSVRTKNSHSKRSGCYFLHYTEKMLATSSKRIVHRLSAAGSGVRSFHHFDFFTYEDFLFQILWICRGKKSSM